MRLIIATSTLIFLFATTGFSQHGKEGCHVYVVDSELATKLFENPGTGRLKECEKNPAKCGVVDFPVFTPTVGEEELTTKTYKFPWAPLTITASVFFTDESLPTIGGDNSVTMTI